jgi:hypothetical protein
MDKKLQTGIVKEQLIIYVYVAFLCVPFLMQPCTVMHQSLGEIIKYYKHNKDITA